MLGLVDCNSFFASCEKVFQPWLADQPVVVLSNNDGIVVARSPEAKQLGIPMGEAFFKIKRLVESNRVKVFSGNYNLYGNLSKRVMKTLENWSPDIEIYSIDEAFLDFGGMTTIEALAKGREIVQTVQAWTGIPVSVGIAPTKTLSKVANETAKAKKMGVCVLIEEADRLTALEQFDIADVWGVGRALVKKFRSYGLRNALQLSQVDPLWMRKHHSIVQEKMVLELRGEPCFTLDEEPQPKQSIQVSRSFGELVEDLEELEESVTKFASRAAEKVREQGSVVSAIQVHIATNWFKKETEEYYSNTALIPFPVPTASTFEIVEAALSGLRRVFQPGRRYKRAGVIMVNLLDAEASRKQGFLFEKDEVRNAARRADEEAVSAVMDRINERFGVGGVFLAAQGVGKSDWQPKREMVSPDFLCSYDELPVVR